ncbi:hypothetical protein [Gordonia sp. OPL2]|uniref:hypothetical protein n=1 Tax=Gordonia sp. OPL2 TaxID=2486274 RepID=UPI0016561B97|nr:hypothetical protein [Gordonia sp. OPL2]ROZ88963.1 hypothetical protein EEB19_19810 [Gordonia sp. OPL2]
MTNADEFDAAFRALESAMGDLATASIRAESIEFPDITFESAVVEAEPAADPGRTADELADLRRWATDENARNAEFARRVEEAIDAELDDLRGGWLPDGRREQIIEDVRAHMLAQLRRFA